MEPMDVAAHLEARKLTRAITQFVQGELEQHLATLSPLLRPRTVLGDFVAGSKQKIPGADVAHRRVVELFDNIARKAPFSIPGELPNPLEIENNALVPIGIQYEREVSAGTGTKSVTISSPLRWTIAFEGFGPGRLREIMNDPSPAARAEVARILIHAIVLHVTVTSQAHLQSIFEALRFPMTEGHLPETGAVPWVEIRFPVATRLPSDDVILQATEIAGADQFEEVAEPGGIALLSDPLKAALERLAGEAGRS